MDFEISTLLLLLFISAPVYLIFKLVDRLWFNPLRIQSILGSQGIKGPSYNFLHGNTKQILGMIAEAMSRVDKEISHDVVPIMQPHMSSWGKQYGKVYLSWRGPRPQLVVHDLELVKEILSNKDGAYAKVKAEGYMKKWVGDSIATSDGEKWARYRKIANHAFHGESLKAMVPSMIAAVEIMLDRWERHDGKEIDVFDEFRLLTADVISRTAFGSSYGEGMKIFDMLQKMGLIVRANILKIRLPGIAKIMPTRDDIESDRLEREIHKCMLEVIRKREEKIRSGELEGYGNDYLGWLLKANQDREVSKKILVQEMVDECKTFYIAGNETTANLLTWTCLLLALHIEWQDKARKEVIELFGEHNHAPDENNIARLKTMNMIINESLRLYPPVAPLARITAREVRLGKIIVPANVVVNASTLVLHHDQEIWGNDVHLFKPERFAEGVLKASNDNAGAFLPFSMGPRMCVGFNFALNEAKIALVMILQRYEFTISPTYVHSPVEGFSIDPQHGVQIILHSRRS